VLECFLLGQAHVPDQDLADESWWDLVTIMEREQQIGSSVC
jgi:hypothetical protein